MTRMFAYADDLVIVSSKYSHRSCQKALDSLNVISDNLGLKFSVTKTKAMSFQKGIPDHQLRLCNQAIEWVSEFKYLGVIIDKNLNFSSHIKYTAKRVRSRLNAMRAITGLPGGANSQVLRKVYQATIRPILDYGCIVVSFASPYARKQLETLQNQAIRTILGAPPWSNTLTCQLEADIMPLQFRHEARQAIFADKVLRNPDHALHSQISKGLAKSREVFTDNTWLYQTTDAWHLHSKDDHPPAPEAQQPSCPWSKPVAETRVHRPYDSKATAPPELVKDAAYQSIAEAESTSPAPLVYFTDGSVNDDGTSGFAFVAPHTTKSFRASDGCSTVQTELAAIREAVRDAATQPASNIVIHTDSQGAIENIRNPSRDNIELNKDIQSDMKQSNKRFIINWVPSHIGIPGNEEADAAAKLGTTKSQPDISIAPSRRQTKTSFHQIAQLRFHDQIEASQSSSVHWRLALPNTSYATAALNRLPRRTQVTINRMRIKAKTARQIVDRLSTCAYCDQDIQCQHVHDLTECPRTTALRQQLLDHLKQDQHVTDKHQLAINILKTQTLRNYKELQNYMTFSTKQ
jgi:ribonuclease HI